MQLHALNENGRVISARRASKQTNYTCLECQEILRLRGGPHRQPHFYHADPNPFCRQHQKGAIHLQLQTYFLNQLPAGECLLEHRFPSIGRVADVAWFSQKIVFEIQYSAISAEEVLARNEDYQKEGWNVVWILHVDRYNKMRLSPAEMALRNHTHYFTNMDGQGKGIIFDQFDLWEGPIRLQRLPPIPIDFQREFSVFSDKEHFPLSLLSARANNWQFSFCGDLASLYREDKQSDYLVQALALEKQFAAQARKGWLRRLLRRWVVTPYRILFRYVLEKSCR